MKLVSNQIEVVIIQGFDDISNDFNGSEEKKRKDRNQAIRLFLRSI